MVNDNSKGELPSVLICQTTYLGDLLLTLPLAIALRNSGLFSRIDMLVRKDLLDVAAGCPAVDHVHTMDKNERSASPSGWYALVREIRTVGYDRAIVLPGSIRTALIPMIAGIPHRVGWDPGTLLSSQISGVHFPSAMSSLPYVKAGLIFERLYRASTLLRSVLPPLYTNVLKRTDGQHRVIDSLNLLHGIWGSLAVVPDPPWVNIPEDIRSGVNRKVHEGSDSLIVIAPGATQPTRRWPEDHFEQLARMLSAHGHAIVILGGPLEREAAGRIEARVQSPLVRSVAGDLSIIEALEVVRRAQLVVANDSASVHMASAMGTPAIALFGPTIPAFGFGPLALGSRIMERDALSCRPCTVYGSTTCPVGTHECLRSIMPQDVFDVVLQMIAVRRDSKNHSESGNERS